jgi:hypothetical protein
MASLEDMTEDQRNSAALKRMMNHPELGLEAKRLWKKIEPTARFPELEVDDKVTSATKAMSDKVEALETQMREGEVLRRREANKKLCEDAGFTFEAVEKVMTDEKILKYDTAINYLRGQSALAPPTPQSVTPIRMPDNLKDIQKNPTVWARNEASAAMNELLAKRAVTR